METESLKPIKHSFPMKVLLVDDQPIIADAIREMIKDEKDITLYFCEDPSKAIEIAEEISPTVILQDLIMPEIDGLMLVRYFRANPLTQHVPMIVLSTKEEPVIKAEAFSLGANDYIVKLPDKMELIARIRYHSLSYIRLLERNEAYEKLNVSQQALITELAEAAEYVRSLLPVPSTEDISTDWRFIPSMQLGGDAFGYHWLDDNYFAFYLLDVCGHGVGAALLSITLMNLLRSKKYGNTDFKNPAEVLTALNENFQMEKQNNMFFTIWYGVYNKKQRQIQYSSGGHPPALLFSGESPSTAEHIELKTPGFVVGGMTDSRFVNATCELGQYNRLFVFSDGVYEITKEDGSLMKMRDFVEIVNQEKENGIDSILNSVKVINQERSFEDDFSLLQLSFA